MLSPQPDKMALASLPTPFHPLTRVSSDLNNITIWLKRDDLTHTLMSGNKLRKLEFVLANATRAGAQAIITCGGVQSNHCRATAIACAQLGLKCHLILRGERPDCLDGNTLLADLAGARCEFVGRDQYVRHLPELFKQVENQYLSSGIQPYSIPTGASDEVGLWGYYSAAKELLCDFDRVSIDPDLICCATGSGGTHAGLALGLHHERFKGKLVAFAVCDDRRYFLDKAEHDISEWYRRYFPDVDPDVPELIVNDQFIGRGYALVDEPVFDTIRYLARTEGVFLDPVYIGKAFHGMLQELRTHGGSTLKHVVFIHTGGVYGLYPYKEQL